MEFTRDEFGKELLLKEGKFQVMMEWERPYMEACIDALQPKGDTLEVGFGCGYSATQIQKYHPKSHTIIEYHPLVAERARAWAKAHPHVRIVEDTWQNALDKLGTFDTIFFDDYPLESAGEQKALLEKGESANLVVREGKKKMAEIEQKFSFLKEMRYSDADIDVFFKLMKSEGKVEPKVFLRFFFDLAEKGNISAVQLDNVLKRLKQEGLISDTDLTKFKESRKPLVQDFSQRAAGDRLFEFLDRCLKKHMKIGSRFSCYLNDPTSKFEDEKFFNLVITNPNLEYHEKLIPIDVPPNCEYYAFKQALVITIVKLA